MSTRGIYGRTVLGADPCVRGSSLGTWLLGGLLVGGAVLWARHQSIQIEKLYATAGLPHQSFGESLRQRSRELTSTAREKIQGFTHRLGTGKES